MIRRLFRVQPQGPLGCISGTNHKTCHEADKAVTQALNAWSPGRLIALSPYLEPQCHDPVNFQGRSLLFYRLMNTTIRSSSSHQSPFSTILSRTVEDSWHANLGGNQPAVRSCDPAVQKHPAVTAASHT